MATTMLSRLLGGLCGLRSDYEEVEDYDNDPEGYSSNDDIPLSDLGASVMNAQNRARRKATYGRKTAGGRLAATFDHPDFSPVDSSSVASRVLVAEDDTATTSDAAPASGVLNELTEAFGNVQIQDHDSKELDDHEDVLWIKPRRSTRSETSSSSTSPKDRRELWLGPLIEAYQRVGGRKLTIQKWEEVLDDDWELVKIAESSFAEVYKVKNDAGLSILKLMALKPPKGPGSRSEYSLPVGDVVPEVMIMHIMTEIRGFVEFKDAHIIDGRPPKAIAEAYDLFAEKKETFFPKPESYNKNQLFLALELGDAGTDVEHFEITPISQVWDIFLATAISIYTGEQLFEFEHRDLHEGNVCVKQVREPTKRGWWSRGDTFKFGHSGLEVTMIDYTLSRITSKDGEVIFKNLEADYSLFQHTDTLQQQMYRRMRNWMFSRAQKVGDPNKDKWNPPIPCSWKDHMPMINAIWLYFLLDYIMKHYKGEKRDLVAFKKETVEFRKLLHPDTRSTYRFCSAADVVKYSLKKEWIDPQVLYGPSSD